MKRMFSKEEIKLKWHSYVQEQIDQGKPKPQAGLNLALLIASSALIGQKLWNGDDYMDHPMFVAMHNTDSMKKKIVGILHDVVEDSDWTIDDLRELGFDEEIVLAVDAVTKRVNEKYVEFIERCGASGAIAIDVKLKDLHHNSINVRTPQINKTEKQTMKSALYNISYYYLLDIKKGKTAPGTKLSDYIQSNPVYSSSPNLVSQVYSMFSSYPYKGKVSGKQGTKAPQNRP